eukprot:gnl/Carplike_NY0171/4890_a6663_393.p1 GENE.gnl/Carplike_NY0171/4890_a6663_393~~gnl/Carplike_NY0171/4890_a6663_393.p1  ORF type:complete len:109 (-),score=16.64 gnl/Carplike_NY0171/4890_a6663_393:233-559(-)
MAVVAVPYWKKLFFRNFSILLCSFLCIIVIINVAKADSIPSEWNSHVILLFALNLIVLVAAFVFALEASILRDLIVISIVAVISIVFFGIAIWNQLVSMKYNPTSYSQ